MLWEIKAASQLPTLNKRFRWNRQRLGGIQDTCCVAGGQQKESPQRDREESDAAVVTSQEGAPQIRSLIGKTHVKISKKYVTAIKF